MLIVEDDTSIGRGLNKLSLISNKIGTISHPLRLGKEKRRAGDSTLKIVAAISRFIYPPEPPTRDDPAPFDDGLIELARLIAIDDPVRPYKSSPATRAAL